MLKPSLFRLLTASSLLLALLPFFLLCYYNQPYLDDFALATLCRTRGWAGAQVFLYQHLYGRFASSLLLTVGNPLTYSGLAAFGIASLVSNTLTLASLWFSLHSLLRHAVGSVAKLAWASGLFLLFVAVIPDIQAALYWFASQATHHLASLFLLLVPVWVARFHQAASRAAGAWWLGLAAFGAFFSGGASEVVTLLLAWLLLVAGGVSLARRERYHASIWAGLLLMLGSAALIDVLAPGTWQRVHNAAGVAAGAGGQLVGFWQPSWLATALGRLLFKPSVLALLLAPLVVRHFAPVLAAVRPRGLHLPLWFSAGVLLVGVLLGAGLMQLAIEGPDLASRCANVLLWWLLLGWLVACWAALPRAVAPPRLLARLGSYFALAVLLVFMGAPIRRAWQEVLVDAPAWHQQCQRRYAVLRCLAATTPHVKVQVSPIRRVLPHYVLIRGYDIATAYNKPYNRDMAAYFGVDSVRVNPRARGAAF